MTKTEQNLFDSMVKKIAYDIRRELSYYKDGKSGTHYVMVPLSDVLSEIRIFTNSIKQTKKRNRK